jgi:glycosyltransferase involved in cell wall biosynthesis
VKVLFSVGYPLSWARGGFTVQTEKTMEALRSCGVDVDWVDFSGAATQDADVIHYWGAPPSMAMWEVARAKGMKQVITFLSPKAILKPGLRTYAERFFRNTILQVLGDVRLFASMGVGLGNADAFIALNEADRRYFNFMYGWSVDKCHVIPNGVDSLFFDKQIVPEPMDGLLYPSYICPRKNQLEIARVAKREKIPVYFAGRDQGESPDYYEKFKKEIDGKYALWLGEIASPKELAKLYRASLGTFLASDYDNQPLILLEALASGRPVMGPSITPVKCHFGYSIIYCDSAKSSHFPKQLREFYNFCQQGRTQSFNVLSWSEVAQKIIDVYTSVLSV